MNNENPDIILLQETKILQAKVDANLAKGYARHFNSAVKPGNHGTGAFSKLPILSTKFGIGVAKHDEEGRVITLGNAHYTFF